MRIQCGDSRLIYDAHACPPFSSECNLNKLKLYKESDVSFLSLNVGFGKMSSEKILPIIKRLQAFISDNSDGYHQVKTSKDILFCQNKKILGIAFDLEGVDALNGDIDMLETYYQLGVRQLLLAYNTNNLAGGGCQDDDEGLTIYGKSIVKKMNEVGIIIDCSHTGYHTTFEIMENSAYPVIFSHSNTFYLCNHKRNIKDDQIKACAQTGGVIGINGIGIFLDESNKATISKMVEHIDHVAQLVGPKHVGIGLDYVFDQNEVQEIVKNNPEIFPKEHGYHEVAIISPVQIPEIALALEKRGFLESDIRGVLGENFFRICKQVWK